MIVILHNIRSLHNVGSIFRTADAAGVEKIYLCGITPAPIDKFGKPRPQFAKVSLGAEKYVKWEKIGSTTSPQATIKLIDKLKSLPAGDRAVSLMKPKSRAGGGYKIFAIEQAKNSIPYHKLPKSYLPIRPARPKRSAGGSGAWVASPRRRVEAEQFRIALILGNEIKGLSPSILKRADKILEIPMKGKKESLNVSVAFAIVIFHLINS